LFWSTIAPLTLVVPDCALTSATQKTDISITKNAGNSLVFNLLKLIVPPSFDFVSS
jgi:hypothetical protein